MKLETLMKNLIETTKSRPRGPMTEEAVELEMLLSDYAIKHDISVPLPEKLTTIEQQLLHKILTK